MEKILPESKKLINLIFTKQQINCLETLLTLIENQEDYKVDLLWSLDADIGYIGGYCMPADPKQNPFPGGIGRELFRPLQYARNEIDILNINYTARHVVHYSGMHLESAVRFVLANNKLLGYLRYQNATLGRATNMLKKLNIIDEVTLQGLEIFIPLNNKAKHDVNQDEKRERLFSPADGLTAYLASRILGKNLLSPYYEQIFDQIGKYLNRLIDLNIKT